MAIDPEKIDTVTISQLESGSLSLANFFAHSLPNGKLQKADIQQLATFLAPYVSVLESSTFLGPATPSGSPISGNPDGFYIAGQGTFTNFGGVVVSGNGGFIIRSGGAFSVINLTFPIVTVVDGFGSYSATNAGSIHNDTELYKLGDNYRTKDNVQFTAGRYIIQSDGTDSNNADYSFTEYIELKKEIEYLERRIEEGYFHAFYDENKAFINVDTNSNYLKKPINAKYYRYSMETTQLNNTYLKLYAFENELRIEDLINSIDNTRLMTAAISWTNGRYIDQGSGADFSLAYQRLSPYIKLSKAFQGIEFNHSIGEYYFAFYDSNKAFISAGNDRTKAITLIPSNAVYFRISINIATTIPELGKWKTDLRTNRNLFNFIVAKDGTGDFTSIQEARTFTLAYSNSADLVIQLRDGVYTESLNFRANFNSVTIVGFDKNKCIINAVTGDYATPAIDGSSNLFISNVTIYETASSQSGTPSLPAYAIHLDAPKVGTTEVYNCILKNNVGFSLGIGTQQDQTIRIKMCEIFGYDKGITGRKGSGILMHNNPGNGVTGQKLELLYNKIVSDNEYVLNIDDAAMTNGFTDNNTQFLFVGNTIYREDGNTSNLVFLTRPPAGAGRLTGNLKLHPASHGNNIAILNY